MKHLAFWVCLCLFFGCDAPSGSTPTFLHDLKSTPYPWTVSTKQNDTDDFSFALVSDLNGGERPGVFASAVEQINRLNPVFTVSVGDLIDGGTKDTLVLAQQWASFNQRASKLNAPFFYVGGNHDLTNAEMRSYWEATVGPSYYHFVYKNVLFLILNSEDFDSAKMENIFNARAEAIKVLSGEREGVYTETEYFKMPERSFGAMSTNQLNYFTSVLRRYNKVRWTFLFMHKPLWKNEESKTFKSLEKMMAGRNYSVFNGHEHSFSFHRINQQAYTTLGTTGGGQNANDPNAFDHISWVSMRDKPYVTHLRLDGVLDETGKSSLENK